LDWVIIFYFTHRRHFCRLKSFEQVRKKNRSGFRNKRGGKRINTWHRSERATGFDGSDCGESERSKDTNARGTLYEKKREGKANKDDLSEEDYER